jgi:hypothetical protein
MRDAEIHMNQRLQVSVPALLHFLGLWKKDAVSTE